MRKAERFNFYMFKNKKLYDKAKNAVTSVNLLSHQISSINAKLLCNLTGHDRALFCNTGTEAVTRVSIESTDSKGKNWFTIGVSANIIDASFKALVDSLDYKLFKDDAPASK